MTCISLRVSGKCAAVLSFCVYSTSVKSCFVCVCGCVFWHVCRSVLYLSVFLLLYVHTCICLYPHILLCGCTCAWTCGCLGVCSLLAWGSICVRLTHWEPLSAGSPGGLKSSGRPEAWNPSRPGQMSLCSGQLSLQWPQRLLKTLRAGSGSQNTDQTTARLSSPKN